MSNKSQNDFVKRLQTRANRKGVKATMQECREMYQSIISDWNNPLEEEMNTALEKLELQANPQEVEMTETEALVVANDTAVENEPPAITEITPESHPDIWEILQPPPQELAPVETPLPESTPEDSKAIAPHQPELPATDLVPTTNNQQLTTSPIPQGHIEGLVNQTFGNQPDGFKEKVTDYALQHSFNDVRQVQDFLEQLRSMEFELLVQTLEDHFKRRDSMVMVVEAVLKTQGQRNEAKTQDFLDGTRTRLANFREEMLTKLSRVGV